MSASLVAAVAALACVAGVLRDGGAAAVVLQRLRAARTGRALERDLPDALRRVAAELGAGRTADRALVAAGEAGGSAGEAFALAGRRAAAGEDIAAALAAALGQRARFAAAAISLQLRAGGICRRCCGRWLAGWTSGAPSTPRSGLSRLRRGCRPASCRCCPSWAWRSPRCSTPARCGSC